MSIPKWNEVVGRFPLRAGGRRSCARRAAGRRAAAASHRLPMQRSEIRRRRGEPRTRTPLGVFARAGIRASGFGALRKLNRALIRAEAPTWRTMSVGGGSDKETEIHSARAPSRLPRRRRSGRAWTPQFTGLKRESTSISAASAAAVEDRRDEHQWQADKLAAAIIDASFRTRSAMPCEDARERHREECAPQDDEPAGGSAVHTARRVRARATGGSAPGAQR